MKHPKKDEKREKRKREMKRKGRRYQTGDDRSPDCIAHITVTAMCPEDVPRCLDPTGNPHSDIYDIPCHGQNGLHDPLLPQHGGDTGRSV